MVVWENTLRTKLVLAGVVLLGLAAGAVLFVPRYMRTGSVRLMARG